MPALSKCGNCGECERCHRAAYMREWYRRPGSAEAQRQSQLASRERRIEYVREYDRKRGHRVYDVAKEKCRQRFAAAIQAGKILRGSCEVCGKPNAEGHHEDYSKPYDVRWLCRPHHMAEHRKVA